MDFINIWGLTFTNIPSELSTLGPLVAKSLWIHPFSISENS